MNLRPRHPAPAPSSLTEQTVEQVVDLIGQRPFRDIVVPRTGIKARLRLCSRKEELLAKAEARKAMIEAGYPVDGQLTSDAIEQLLAEQMVRMIAIAVREPGTDPNPRALAPLEDWQECDDLQLLALWTEYQDHGRQFDPIGFDSLSAEEVSAIIAAAKKKDVDSLMAFGSRRLAIYTLTSASPPASSETPTSSSGSPPS